MCAARLYVVVLVCGIVVIALRTGDLPCIHGNLAEAQSWLQAWHVIPPPACYIATHQLLPNHRLSDVDFAQPKNLPGNVSMVLPMRTSLVGKYVASHIEDGAAIRLDNLLSSPAIEVGNRVQVFLFPLNTQPQLDQILDVNWHVDILGSDKPVVTNASVLALMSGPPPSGTNAVLLAIPINQLTALSSCVSTAGLRLLPTPPQP